MSPTRFTTAIALLLALCACSSTDRFDGEYQPRPSAEFQAAVKAGRMPAGAVVLRSPDGRAAYLMTAACCDQFNPLYDAEGRYICAPTGGIGGLRDGRCPAWVGSAVPVSRNPSASHLLHTNS